MSWAGGSDEIGAIIPIPRWPIKLAAGCLYCDGKEYPVAEYPDLFKEIGYQHGGAGTMFAVPNCNEGVHKFVIRSGMPVEEGGET